MRADEQQSTELLKTFVEELVAITPGEAKFPKSFTMGGSAENPNEKTEHSVSFGYSFAIAKYEVPQNLYEDVMGSNPSKWKGPRNSVEMMSWDEANDFCRKITKSLQARKLIADNEVIRLPTEAEWEYCCRAGTTTRYSFGDEPQAATDVTPKATILDKFGWHTGNAAGNDPPVGALKPNPWGLYDMHGYLWEFTSDAWTTDPKKMPADGSSLAVTDDTQHVVIRSGSWKDRFEALSSTSRKRFQRSGKDDAVGFRCVKAPRGSE